MLQANTKFGRQQDPELNDSGKFTLQSALPQWPSEAHAIIQGYIKLVLSSRARGSFSSSCMRSCSDQVPFPALDTAQASSRPCKAVRLNVVMQYLGEGRAALLHACHVSHKGLSLCSPPA